MTDPAGSTAPPGVLTAEQETELLPPMVQEQMEAFRRDFPGDEFGFSMSGFVTWPAGALSDLVVACDSGDLREYLAAWKGPAHG